MIKAIALDLDDTLIDTSGLLAPQATLDAFDTLIKNGLKLSLVECENQRLELIKSISHREVFEKLAQEYGDTNTVKAAPLAIDLFYNPVIPAKLPLMPGARENLDYLKKKYSLFLVTAGTEDAQIQKAKALGIYDDFSKIYVVNSLKKERKKDSFLDILKNQNLQASELLCVGNSISSEMTDAIALNAVACYFEFGENRGELSSLTRPPQFHIRHHSELIPTCRL